MRDIRGNAISMIFQEPMTSLNPVLTVGRQIGETLQLHQGMYARDAEQKAIEMLALVGIPAPDAARARVSAPVVRRHAPAGDDRDGAGVQSQAADRR